MALTSANSAAVSDQADAARAFSASWPGELAPAMTERGNGQRADPASDCAHYHDLHLVPG
jgi:hypothetical protein